jgi:hypothetical protein
MQIDNNFQSDFTRPSNSAVLAVSYRAANTPQVQANLVR